MTNEQIRIKALDIISRRRQRAITLLQQHEADISARIPQYTAMKNKRLAAGVSLALVSLNGADTPEALSAAQSLKAIDNELSNFLLANSIDKSELQAEFVCKICNDTGRTTSGSSCKCVDAIEQDLRRKDISKASPIELCSFENFSLMKYSDKTVNNTCSRDIMSGMLTYCKAYAADFNENSDSLYVYGNAGIGKTHLALSIANEVLEKGFNVLYVSAQSIFDVIEREHFSPNNSTTMDSLLSAQLLILDDLGTEYLTPYVGSCLYDVINTRWNRKQPTIYTSNFTRMEDLAKRYTEKIVSRLMGSCTAMHFSGDDIRLMEEN